MKIVVCLVSTAMLSFAAIAMTHAASSDEPKSVTVRFADLDLRKTDGAAALLRRIRKAAKQVCQISTSESLRKQKLRRACFERAVSNAVAQVDSPVLNQYVASQSLPDGQMRPATTALR